MIGQEIAARLTAGGAEVNPQPQVIIREAPKSCTFRDFGACQPPLFYEVTDPVASRQSQVDLRN